MHPGRPPSSEDPSPPAAAFDTQGLDTVRLSAAELKRQLEAHGLKNITENDVAAPVGDADAHLQRLIDD